MTEKYPIYSSNRTDTERYLLGKPGNPTLFVVGLNPSTATREKSDTTVAKVEQIALKNGFPGFVMLNLYPLRATMPDDLPEKGDRRAIQRNLKAIEQVLKEVRYPVVWAAWGDGVRKREYLGDCRDLIQAIVLECGGKWVRYGELTKAGNPRHPSRVGYGNPFSALGIHT